jgi:hypothetical protein
MGRYQGPIGPLTFGADIGYTGTSNECSGRVTAGTANFTAGCVGNDQNLSQIRGSFYASWSGWGLGLGYSQLKNGNGNGLNRTVWAPGLDYTTGPWKFGFYYSTGAYDTNRAPLVTGPAGTVGVGTATGPAVKSTDNMDQFSLDGQYTLGPGITLQGQLGYQRYKYGVNAAYRNAGDFGFSSISSQNSYQFILGAFFAY